MEGILLSYKHNLSRNDITNINYFLFGKVLTKKAKKYYYPGLLNDVKYVKMGNGCYFIGQPVYTLANVLLNNDNVIIYTCSLDILDSALLTAREIKSKQYNGVFVKNL